MKIKKIEPQDFIEKKLDYKTFRKFLKPVLRFMVESCDSQENAIPFFIKTNFEFSDFKGKKMAVLVPGNQNANWVKLLKEELKTDKKNICLGECFIKNSENGSYQFIVCPEKGSAKKNLMIKQVEKFVFKGLPFSLEIESGGELEEDDAKDIVLEDVVVADTEEEVLEAETELQEQIDPRQLKLMAKEIISSFKEIQSQFERKLAGSVFVKVSQWSKSYEVSDTSIQTELKDIFDTIQKMSVYLKKIIQIDQAIDKEIQPLYKEIDKHNEMVERGNPEAVKIQSKLMASFDKLTKWAADIKDAGLVDVISEFKSQLK